MELTWKPIKDADHLDVIHHDAKGESFLVCIEGSKNHVDYVYKDAGKWYYTYARREVQDMSKYTHFIIPVPVKNERLEKIRELEVKLMHVRSGQGLMSYNYRFLQIGGFVGQSYDNVGKAELWDGESGRPIDAILDCRGGKCERVSWDVLEELLKVKN